MQEAVLRSGSYRSLFVDCICIGIMAKGNSISIHNVNDLFILKEVEHSGADILDPRSQRAGSYKFGAVIVNV